MSIAFEPRYDEQGVELAIVISGHSGPETDESRIASVIARLWHSDWLAYETMAETKIFKKLFRDGNLKIERMRKFDAKGNEIL